MSQNLASILVGLGYDLSALEKGAPEAFRLVNEHTLGMSAEMKRSSREGAESFRLIDEALGIHVSRPLTKILTQEFPALASGLQAVLGGAVFGAVATVAVEAFEKATKSIENAQKAEGELNTSTRNVGEVFAEAMQSYEKADKLRSLSGLDKTLFEIDSSSIEQSRKKIDDLTAAIEKQSKAAAEAKGWWTEFKAGVGDIAHITFSAPSDLNAEKISEQFSGNAEKGIQSFQQRFDAISKMDALHGTHDSAKFLADEMAKAQASLTAMMERQATPIGTFLANNFKDPFGLITPPQQSSNAEIDAAGKVVTALQQMILLQNAGSKDQTGRGDVAKQTEALTDMRTKISLQDDYNKEVLRLSGPEYEQAHLDLLQQESNELKTHLTLVPEQAEEIKKLAAEMKEIHFKLIGEEQVQEIKDTQADLAGWNQESNAIAKKWDDINEQLAKSPLLITASKGTMESLMGTGAGTDPFLRVWDEGKAALEDLSARAQQFQKIWGSMTTVLPPAGAPAPSDTQQLLRTKQAPSGSPLGVNQEQLDSWTRAQQVIDSLETPLEKYNTQLAMLQELEDQGRLSTEQFAAAQQKLQEQLAESTNKLEELLKKTGDTTAGFQAFYMQLEKSGNQQGAFTYDLLNKGLQGFEDQTVQALTGGKAQWDKYFEGLTQSALKFMLNKGVAQALQLSGLGNALGIPGAGPGTPGLPAADQAVAGAAPSIAGGGAGGAPSAMNLPQMAFAPLSSLMKMFLGIPGEGDNSTSSAGAPPLSPLNLPASAFAPLQGPLNGSLSSSLNGTSGAASAAPLTTAGTQLSLAATQLQAAAAALSAGNLGTTAGTAEGTGGGGTGFSALSLIPGGAYAEGTDYAPGGASLVGEEGPEIVNLPTGSSVTPNASSLRNGPAVHNWYIDARGNEEVGERIQHALSQALPAVEQRAINAVSEIHARTPH